MVAPGGSYDWTKIKRHVVHLCSTEFDLEKTAAAKVYEHIFKGASFKDSRIWEEWEHRQTSIRSVMWRTIIDKPVDQYTSEEEADRQQARHDIRAALTALNIASATNSLPNNEPPCDSITTKVAACASMSGTNTTATTSDLVKSSNNMDSTQDEPVPENAATFVTNSASTKRQASFKSPVEGQVKRRPKLTRLRSVTLPSPEQTNHARNQIPRSASYESCPIRDRKSPQVSSSIPKLASRAEIDIQRQLEEAKTLIKQQHDEIVYLREDNEYFCKSYQEKVKEADMQFQQSSAYYDRFRNAERLVERMISLQTTGEENQANEKSATLGILLQAQVAHDEVAKLKEELTLRDTALARKDGELQAYKQTLDVLYKLGDPNQAVALAEELAGVKRRVNELE